MGHSVGNPMKIAVGIEYCGAAYAGWQRQKHTHSVQEYIQSALSNVADHEVRVHCAGRTDAGVHALQQVVHFETGVERNMRSWVLGGNVHLPADISLLWAQIVDDDFHARFSASSRIYSYIILNRTVRPGLMHRRVTWECRELDDKLMQQASTCFIGEHDFTSYRSVQCQANTPMRNVKRLDIHRTGEVIVMEIEANAFLHHMVRNIAGVLMAIGMGKAPPEWSRQVLDARNRTRGGVTAPADGLYLMGAVYPQKFGIPDCADKHWPFLLR
ncbi:MAG: tRNA pseudouridine(38-40) synthase TruA [Gammaproteobacteria bacterium]